ncbi:MAG: ABC transporter substrate-binding protein [Clostridia bacterium]
MNWGNYINQKNLSMYSIDSHYVQVLAFNMKKPLLEEARVRKGIALSLNTAEILKNVWLSKGTLAEAPIYPNGWYSPTNQANYTYDMERAGEYLQNAIDSQLTVLVNSSIPDQEAIGLEIVDQLQRIGFVAALDQKEEAAFQQALQEGNFDLALCGV